MKLRIQVNQDVLAGLMFMLFGAFFLYFGRNYPVGTTLRMGPGYLAMVLGWLLVAIGAFIGGKRALKEGDALTRWALRPLFLVSGAFIVFAQLIERVGLVATAVVCMVFAACGGQEFKWREQIILAVIAAAVAATGFIHFLGLPMRYLPEFLGYGY